MCDVLSRQLTPKMFHNVFPLLLSSCYHLCMHILRDVEANQRLIVDDVMQRLDELKTLVSLGGSPPFPSLPPPPLHPPDRLPSPLEDDVAWWVYALSVLGCIVLCFSHPLTLLCVHHAHRNVM